ncbi:MAG: HTH domain-containing protein [Marinifilaceae bacterium]|nr:HTH domain-containing protein [Marinifilaceae bacterium]
MTHLNILEKAEFIKEHAEKESTGTPTELAQRLNISERSLYRIISSLKNMGHPITYRRCKQSYCYENKKGKAQL